MIDASEIIASTLVPAPERTALGYQATQAQAFLTQLEAWPCNTPRDEADLAEFLTAVKDQIKGLEEKRKTITAPLHHAKTAVDALFRPARTFYESAETLIKGKLGAAADRRNAERQLALQAAAEAARAGQTAQAQASLVLAATATQAPPPGVRERRDWEVFGWARDLVGIPLEFLTVDWAKVNAYMAHYRASEAIPPIPGITFQRKTTIIGSTSR